MADLVRRVGVAPDRLRRQLAKSNAREFGGRHVLAAAAASAREAVLAALDRHHREHPLEHGATLDRLLRLAGLPDALANGTLRDLVASGEAAQAGPLFRRADFDPRRGANDAVRSLERIFRDAGLSPPDEADAVGRDAGRRDALTYLLQAGTIVRALDRVQKRTVLFHQDAIAAARLRLAAAFPAATTPETGFLAREAGAALGTSRKFSIPLLEHLDKTGFTRRAGDRRALIGGESTLPSVG